ncbi:MAG: GDSL-type esterase/lipase family protein [Phycisphaerales bacterium]
MPKLAPLLAALFSLLLVSCAHDQPPAPTTQAAPQAETSPAQPAWYEPEIQAFETADRTNPPAPGQVLFIGSSSIRMWKSLADDMAPAPVLNRGFGGSKTPEVLAVMDRIVSPYDPAVIVYYCGDNDLGDNNTDSRAAADGFIDFAKRVHKRRPLTPILYLSIKPSIARWSNWDAMDRANHMVADYAATHRNVEFIDVGACLLKDGAPDPALFRADGLHLNADGYARWTEIVRPRVLAAWRRR